MSSKQTPNPSIERTRSGGAGRSCQTLWAYMSSDPNEVPTLERWLPSPLSKVLAATVPSIGTGTFVLARANTAWFGIEAMEPLKQTAACLLLSLLPMLLVSWLLIAELIHIVNSKKHRILTFNYAQPHAALVFVLVAIVMFFLGFYAASP